MLCFLLRKLCDGWGSKTCAEEAPMNGGLDIQDVSIEVQLFKRGKGGYDFSLRERGSETCAEEAPPRTVEQIAGRANVLFFWQRGQDKT